MKINVPKHLIDIKIVNQMYKMMTAYSKMNNTSDIINSDITSLEEKAFDYIYELLRLIYPANDDPTNRYLAFRFYECKGTREILSMLERYLGLVYKEEPKYNINVLELNFESVKGTNIQNFNPALINFLNALLYFNSLFIVIDIFKLYIDGEMSNKSANAFIYYKESHFELN